MVLSLCNPNYQEILLQYLVQKHLQLEQLHLEKEVKVWNSIITLLKCNNIILPLGENPSCLQITLASSGPHLSSHTVPQCSLKQISTRPSDSDRPPTSLISSFWHIEGVPFAEEKRENSHINSIKLMTPYVCKGLQHLHCVCSYEFQVHDEDIKLSSSQFLGTLHRPWIYTQLQLHKAMFGWYQWHL